MQSDDIPHTTDSPLSTENLAQPRETDEAPGDSSQPPAYPGEGEKNTDATRDAQTPPADEAARVGTGDADEMPQLLTTQDTQDFRQRWEKIQTTFVDDPREAVHAADSLVAGVMQTLAATFDEHKKNLEEQWNQGQQADTEALRTALRHYRSFFNRLLTS
ncbi:hypothetical protein [Streptomyces sp. NPDC057545]|uniref:hypothetical protein n=1 Tax=Streptomyces sp. NPDC057545 TaxID=3346164 RepID=UPI003688DAAB